ncbi:MAG: hypothetical protein PHH42_14560, partial [Bacteroidales bacterium]|nr:hypothetical protein [Bacteroidales bacterium]
SAFSVVKKISGQSKRVHEFTRIWRMNTNSLFYIKNKEKPLRLRASAVKTKEKPQRARSYFTKFTEIFLRFLCVFSAFSVVKMIC